MGQVKGSVMNVVMVASGLQLRLEPFLKWIFGLIQLPGQRRSPLSVRSRCKNEKLLFFSFENIGKIPYYFFFSCPFCKFLVEWPRFGN